MRSQSLRDRAAAVVLPGLRHPNRTVCLGINTSVGVARRPMIELKLETNLKQLTLTNVCADDLRTRLRTIRGTANEQSNKTMNVGNRGEQRMHECLCRLRDQKCVYTTSQLMYRACVALTQAQMCPNHCKRCGLTLHTLAHTPAHNKRMQTLQNMITTPRVGVSNLCQNHCVANARDGESQLQAQSTQIGTIHKMHRPLNTIINPKPAVFSLSQNEGNPFGVTGRTINSLDGRGFETTISHFRQRTENCDKFFDFRIRDTDTEVNFLCPRLSQTQEKLRLNIVPKCTRYLTNINSDLSHYLLNMKLSRNRNMSFVTSICIYMYRPGKNTSALS